MSSDTWGSRSHSNRNVDDNQLTTTTMTSLGGNKNNNNTNTTISNPSTNIPHNNPPGNNPGSRRPAYHNNYRRNPRHSHKRSRSRSYSRSRSRSHSRSMNASMSRSPTPKKRLPSNRHNDHNRKRNPGGPRPYHSRRPKRHTRELPYPSRSRSTSKSRTPSHSKSRSPSYSNDSDDARRHRRHNRKSRPMGRDNRYKHRHGHRARDNMRGTAGASGSGSGGGGGGGRYNPSHRGGKNESHNENGNMYRNDRSGGRGNNTYKKPTQTSNSGASSNDKVPVSFKEFTNTMLEDDVTAQEAQKRYEKYLQRFSKSDDVLFFEAHKDEEWFQERYDPIIIEKSIESRRQNARNHYWKFYQEFLADKLPQIHDNTADFKSVPNTIKPPSPSPTDDNENEEGEQEEDNNNNKDNDKDTNGDISMKNEGNKPTITTTTTTIGADTGNSMDVDNNTVNNDKYDGKLRLPKYADIMYRDDYEPHIQRMDDYHSHTHNNNRNECYQNSIFIQGIPLHIQREKIFTPFAKCEGFCKLILSDPIRNSRKVRYGWVTFNNQENCRKALLDVSEGGLNGHQLTGQYFMNLLPKQKSKRRPKFSPPESLYPHRVDMDIKQTLQCCKKFDAEAGITNNALLQDKLLHNLCVIRRLNVLLLYLRHIHFLCYYCGKHFLSEEHMFARCSGTHERKVPADPSLAMSGNIDIDNNTTDIIKKEKTNWEKDLDQRINDVINYVIDHKHCWIERKQCKMLEKNSKKVSEGKFRCTICSKLFKAQIYVTKHIKNKHQDEIAKYIADQRLRTMFENYRRDRDRLTIRSFEDNDDKRDGQRPKRGENKMSAIGFGKNNVMHGGLMKSNVMHNHNHNPHPHPRHIPQQIFASGLAPGSGMPLHAQTRGPLHPHLMMSPYGHMPPPNYAYVAPPGHGHGHGPPTPVGADMPAPFVPPQNGNNANANVNVNVNNSGGSGGSGAAMHPERASNIAGVQTQAKQGATHGSSSSSSSVSISPPSGHQPRGGGGGSGSGGGARGYGGGGGYGGIRGRGGAPPLRSSMYDEGDPYGRKIPVHFQEPATRTRRSYREVDIEYPVDEVEEEIDYGFGDFVKNPTKFNL